MKSIRDFNAGSGNGNIGPDNRFDGDVNALKSKYAGKSESELLALLKKNVAAAKSNGSFSPEKINELVRLVSPGLDDGSRERLNGLVAMIMNE